ncbi:helicase protein MOM1-like [Quillaja saponaria]|uniref:Helicase protein MOM1-like n=1 Tax=Quillaja saponaria TaxID=32244 RepID=A0AAD7QGS7_QUISA|nr:helicase protein MOM1-like [Quillaja saponaria]
MANDTHSSGKSKDKENKNSKGCNSKGKGKINSGPSSTRKSARIQKLTPTPAINGEPERVEQQTTPSPLRRSKGLRIVPLQILWGQRKLIKAQDRLMKSRSRHARAYRSMFNSKKANVAGPHEECNGMDKLSSHGGSKRGGKVDTSGSTSVKETSENDVTVKICLESQKNSFIEDKSESEVGGCMEVVSKSGNCSPLPSNDNSAKEMSEGSERVQVGICAEDTLLILSLRNSTSKELAPSKRKRNITNSISDAYATISNNDICKTGDFFETCGTLLKKKRVDHDARMEEACPCSTDLNQETLGPSGAKDRGEIEASISLGLAVQGNICVQQNGSSIDFQKDGDLNLCLICKLEGKLLFCDGKGCNRCYHLSCLEPPIVDVPYGVWHCHACVKKKIESGVHSVSEGVESIWDTREVDASDINGSKSQKQFLVKYRGLAHVHNLWLPESQLHLEAPSLLRKFNENYKDIRWKSDWSMPHRLLQKRQLTSTTEHDDYNSRHAGDNFDCHYEWLVKWCGLGYEHATWELENASFLCSPEGQSLIRDYEDRRKRANGVTSISAVDKRLDRESSIIKLSELPAGVPPGSDNNRLHAVNKLLEHRHKNQNAIVVDDQDRIMKLVAFVLSLQSHVSRPFLIISTPAAIHSWEDKFLHLAPSFDAIVYNGTKEMRQSIRKLVFYGEGGCIMFQALITLPEVILEDIDVLGCIEWEAVIVDDCQCSEVSTHFEQLKVLRADMRILLASGQLKDSVAEYINMLALLDSDGDKSKFDGLISNCNDNIAQLKDKFSRYIAHGCKADTSRFVEYWVPVAISNVQLDQYCATLLSNALALRSSSKNDPVGALRDVLISTRKCCDHPYIVDPSLQDVLAKGLQAVEYLDVGIRASGKLQLLDRMLMEIKKQGLRVLILFESIGGSGRDSIGDILDDFLRQRYGPDSYERVDKGLLYSKKQAALKMFNNKDCGRFVFLLETCACLPGIKLSSVDSVIIFDSDWNPMNDIRSLQKITLDSQIEKIKIFRLYSSSTVEEKVLILAKQDKTLDSNLQYLSRSTSHMLLMWGASCLFDDLEVFHCGNTPCSVVNTFSGQSLLGEVVHEFSSILSQDEEDNRTSKFSNILNIKQSGGTYTTNLSLLGERKASLMDDGPPHMFWTKLLEGKHPRWKYSSGLFSRNRKRVQQLDDSVNRQDTESDDIVKKRKKVVNNCVDQASLKSGVEGNIFSGSWEGNVSQSFPCPTNCTSDSLRASYEKSLAYHKMVESLRATKLRDAQNSLHLLLKQEVAKLCDILHLPDNVKDMVEKFLEYVLNNHHVNKEPVSVLQAFQISLCWTAASLLKHKIDHKASLMLAKEQLHFDCKKEEADYVYSMLRCLKKKFLHRTGLFSVLDSDTQVYSSPSVVREVDLAEKDITKSIKEIQKKCQKKLKKLLQKQQEWKCHVDRTYEEKKEELERKHRIESSVIRTCTFNPTIITDKLNILDNEYAQRVEELKWQHDTQLNELEKMHLEARQKNVSLESDHFDEEKNLENIANDMSGIGVGLFNVSEIDSSKGVACGIVVEPGTFPLENNSDNNKLDTVISGAGSTSEEHSSSGSLCDNNGNAVSLYSHSRGQNPNGVTVSIGDEGVIPLVMHENDSTCGGMENAIASELPSSERQICDGRISGVPSGEGPLEACETGSSSCGVDKVSTSGLPSSEKGVLDQNTLPLLDQQSPFEVVEIVSSINNVENAASMHPSSSEERIPDGVTISIPEIVGSRNDINNVFTMSSPLSVEQTPVGTRISVPDREVSLVLPGTTCSIISPEDVVSVNPPSYMEQIPDGATTSMHDREVPLRVSSNVSSSDGPDGVVSLYLPPSKEPISTEASLSIPETEGQIPVDISETTSDVVEFHNDKESHGVDAISLGNTTEPDQQAYSPEPPMLGSPSGQPLIIPSQVAEISICQDPNLAGPILHLQDQCTLQATSTGVIDGDATAIEIHSSSEHVELASCPVNAVRSDRSSHKTMVMAPVEQTQLLPSTESIHSSQDLSNSPSGTGIEHQPSSAEDISNHIARIPVQTVEVSNQSVAQSVSNSEHYPGNTAPANGLGTLLADTRTVSNTSQFNNRPLQNASQVASRMPLASHYDPLHIELERIRKETDQTIKNHEDMKLRLNAECEKEIEQVVSQIRTKYDNKIQEIEVEFVGKKKHLDTSHNVVLMNKILAEAFRSKCMDLKVSGALGMHQDASFAQQLLQLSRLQNVQRPSMVAGLSSSGPPAAIFRSISSTASTQITQPLVQAAYQQSAIMSSDSTRPPHINSISPHTFNHQAGSEMRAPAPHLQPFRPSTSMHSISHPMLPRGMSNQQAPNGLPATSPQFPQLPPRIPPPTYQSSSHHVALRPEAAGTSAASNFTVPALELLMEMNHRSAANSLSSIPRRPDLVSSNLPQFGLCTRMHANSVHSHPNADVVCLSDDD